MTVVLPDELAPALRERALQLIAECGESVEPERTNPATAPRHEPCHVCKKTSGRKGGHHLADGTVVRVHRKCHVKLHRSQRAQLISVKKQRAAAGLKQLGLV